MSSDEWEREWDEAIALVGKDLSNGESIWGVEALDHSSLRRFVEVVEIASPLHSANVTAADSGRSDLVAPVSMISQTLVDTGYWHPGEPEIFTSADPHAQPVRRPGGSRPLEGIPGPAMPAAMATEFEAEYYQEVKIGDRLCRRGRRLISCKPKETSVGRGAFLVLESDYLNQDGVLVARARQTIYVYRPFEAQ